MGLGFGIPVVTLRIHVFSIGVMCSPEFATDDRLRRAM